MRIKHLIATLLCATACITAAAQSLHLPASHTNQHNDLIANQRPLNKNASMYADRRISRERAALYDNDVYSNNWESDHVNPYGSDAVIPAMKDIDVSGYHAPIRSAVTSPYGYRARFGRMHRGIDLKLNVGDTVRAAFDGKVRLTKYEGKGYGYYVVVRHDNGMETVYGHLSKFLVKPNEYVRAGQPIALGGNTGRSTGPHLHFETRYMGLAINPAAIIDFDNHVAHRDVFTFNKATYDKGQNYSPRRASKSKATRKSSGRKSKATSSKKRTTRRR